MDDPENVPVKKRRCEGDEDEQPNQMQRYENQLVRYDDSIKGLSTLCYSQTLLPTTTYSNPFDKGLADLFQFKFPKFDGNLVDLNRYNNIIETISSGIPSVHFDPKDVITMTYDSRPSYKVENVLFDVKKRKFNIIHEVLVTVGNSKFDASKLYATIELTSIPPLFKLMCKLYCRQNKKPESKVENTFFINVSKEVLDDLTFKLYGLDQLYITDDYTFQVTEHPKRFYMCGEFLGFKLKTDVIESVSLTIDDEGIDNNNNSGDNRKFTKYIPYIKPLMLIDFEHYNVNIKTS
jgi:hypothetical protein